MINKNKFSSKYEYSIFTRELFDKPKLYTLCYKEIPIEKKWWHDFFRSRYGNFSSWTSVAEDGTSAYGYKKPYFTESIEKINAFMEWNINKDNKKNELL